MRAKNEPAGSRRKPQEAARQSARIAAQEGRKVSDCPYKSKAWRGVWLKAFAETQQQDLFA